MKTKDRVYDVLGEGTSDLESDKDLLNIYSITILASEASQKKIITIR